MEKLIHSDKYLNGGLLNCPAEDIFEENLKPLQKLILALYRKGTGEDCFYRADESFSDRYLLKAVTLRIIDRMLCEAETRNILRGLPVTTLFIDGNHENFEQLNSYGVDTWNGGKVHFIEGQVFCIDGIKFFTFGGAHSIDKMYRSEGISWFPEEIPSREEYEEGWSNLEKSDFQVDYILTHTGPREIVAEMGYVELSDDEVELRQFLQRVADNTDFTAWYFGHFHEDAEVEEMFFCLYDEMVELC